MAETLRQLPLQTGLVFDILYLKSIRTKELLEDAFRCSMGELTINNGTTLLIVTTLILA